MPKKKALVRPRSQRRIQVMTVPMVRQVARMISPTVLPEHWAVSGDQVPPIITESGSRPEQSTSAAILPHMRTSSRSLRVSGKPPAVAQSGKVMSRSVPEERWG